MKRLFILRHAEAAPAGGFADFERPLTDKGQNDATILGAKMKKNEYQPDFIFCSPALRTSQTLNALTIGGLKSPNQEFPNIIYEGGILELKDIIKSTENRYKSILLIGHNPSIHQLSFDLANDSGHLVNQLSTGYPPATLSVLDCPMESWNELKPGENKLVDIVLAG